MTSGSLSSSSRLSGVRVIVTRATHQAAGLRAAFEKYGADVAQLPLLEICPPKDSAAFDQALGRLAIGPGAIGPGAVGNRASRPSPYQWLMFTSKNAVEAFLRLREEDLPPGIRIAAVGRATAQALRPLLSQPGAPPPLLPDQHSAEGLLQALASEVRAGQRVLLPQAADARPTLSQGLVKLGLEVDAVTAYDKALPPESRRLARTLLQKDPLGWVTFTSPRIVRHFLELLGEAWKRRLPGLKTASIGPITSAELRRHGIAPTAEALHPGDAELAAAVADLP
ncbi:MAG: uroporphyrinogen-III synthase [Deltaproteobacteria bacterium]|nr:uroporphyrinogen-III synthase [Deltaproteobacteria bacterium]